MSLHVAIVMDGNGRWAASRGLPRSAGHRAGTRTVRHIVEAAPSLGVTTLTLYAFSGDNWQRPPGEVALLMKLLRRFVHRETPNLKDAGIRLEVIGRRDRLDPVLRDTIARAERETQNGPNLTLRIAIDYSARHAIVEAARGVLQNSEQPITEECLASHLGPDVDLLIRTSGEQRLSDFLLWECAYAEFFFSRLLWPDFTAQDLAAAIDEFHGRDRRFGGLSARDDERKSA